MNRDFYRLRTPSEWTTRVDVWSWSSLRAVERCPLQWQLENSRWPGFDRLPRRPAAKAIEGELVHGVLEELFKNMARRAMPAEGTPAFIEAVRATRVTERLAAGIQKHHEILAQHPRAASFRLPFSAAQLYNQVTRLFRQQYVPRGASVMRGEEASLTPPSEQTPGSLADRLRRRGALAEETIEHPSVPLKGRLDLVSYSEGRTTIADFKTGEPRPEHQEQLRVYGVLWWRATGVVPTSLVVQYPKERVEESGTAALLAQTERDLTDRIKAVTRTLAAPPARALLGGHCAWCSVRAFCDAWWSAAELPSLACAAQSRRADLEGVVCSVDSGYALTLTARGGRRLPVVHDQDGATLHGPFAQGEALRIVDAMIPSEGREVRLVRMTEVFHRTPPDLVERDPRRPHTRRGA